MMEDIDRIEFWDSKPFIDAANILVASDEPLRALQLLDNLPGLYREYVPQEVAELKGLILSKLATNSFYATDRDDEKLPDPEVFKSKLERLLRWKLIYSDVREYNLEGVTPHIIDFGPGEYWLPIMLQYYGCKFTYQDIYVSHSIRAQAMERLGDIFLPKPPSDRPVIYVACEILEHLHFENDIAVECLKSGATPSIIHVSTPRFTYDISKARLDWKRFGELGHLRTYTLSEFYWTISKMFPDYKMQAYDSKILHVRGVRRGDAWEDKLIEIDLS